jgi:hypothetical protein
MLGVVRATVDYDWGHERRAQAVTVLLESADAAYPELKQKLQLEAARKLTGLALFYQAELAVLQGSALERSEKTTRVAQLRRGMIAAATQLGN